MHRLPADVQTLYAELLDQLVARDAQRSIGSLAGSFVDKTIKGGVYTYFQYSAPGGLKQIYLGPRSRELQRLAARFATERARDVADRAAIERLCALMRVGGAALIDTASARVIAALGDAAVFRLGGTLVGTHAFIILGNMLGMRWDHGLLRTDDLDVAGERRLAVAVSDQQADIPATLASLDMGFLPVPGLSPAEPATSFKVRGRSLRVDLLTPAIGPVRGPVPLARFAAAAEPLRFLEYLLADTQLAASISGSATLVRVPQPARFALHKLLVAQLRPAAFQSKADKDLRQAAQLILALAEDRPGDLALAWHDLEHRGSTWKRTATSGLTLLARRAPEAAAALRAARASR